MFGWKRNTDEQSRGGLEAGTMIMGIVLIVIVAFSVAYIRLPGGPNRDVGPLESSAPNRPAP